MRPRREDQTTIYFVTGSVTSRGRSPRPARGLRSPQHRGAALARAGRHRLRHNRRSPGRAQCESDSPTPESATRFVATPKASGEQAADTRAYNQITVNPACLVAPRAALIGHWSAPWRKPSSCTHHTCSLTKTNSRPHTPATSFMPMCAPFAFLSQRIKRSGSRRDKEVAMLANGVQVSSPKAHPMSKIVAAALSAFLITASSLAYAQVSTGPAQSSGPTQAGPAQERLRARFERVPSLT